ncbi:MAG: TerB family tellurite resistance protein [Kiritimatiellae bacterium]|nr:TerB family tellurite resistance protein [Kiritimatiellia bacterium]
MKNDSISKRIRHREDMFLRRLFGILARMAKVDGKVDAWEVNAAVGAFARFPRAAARRKFCVSVFNSSKNGRTPLRTIAAEFEKKWAAPEDCLAVYELLWDIACAKGVLRPSHKNALRDLCVPLGLPPNYFTFFYRRRCASFREVADDDPRSEAHKGRRSSRQKRNTEQGKKSERRRQPPPPKTPLQEAYDLLGCRSSDTNDVLRRAYREAAKRHHPDMLRARGCSERQICEACETMSRINAAWEVICNERKL